MNRTEIYLDHAATTPVDPRVLEAMLPYFSQKYGNPSSIYAAGREARAALDQARARIARLLNCQAREIVFTSGGTESDNLALKGVAWWHRLHGRGNHIITTAFEHHAVLHSAHYLEKFGFEVTYVRPGSDGIVRVEEIEAAIRPDTILISVMYANNEIGTIQPIAEIGRLARERGITFHTDAVQAAGALSLDVTELNVDLLSLSAHKFYAPKGVGLLYVRRETPILWQQQGGAQESNRRAGTENVAGIVGMATALELAYAELEERNAHVQRLRDRLIDGLLSRIPGTRLNGDRERRLPNNVNVSFEGIDGETVLLNLDMHGIAASSGSACTTGSTEPSHVLLSIGLHPDLVRGSIRLTLGKDNTEDEIDRTLDVLEESIIRLRRLATARAR
ncbi:cysteine desulfurase NifS [Thermomicrobiaceae bacterium CFH 74404]|uniref:Cysteine desulfurase IscS n=1 Tax=Thermalbibacter longus TaxID=2951981 RepID=A0AA41WAM4_9BACT|nr:cysteine desulfurase NifS [Thermalbibacter longus]MCM8748842.1 cysteine desulfurase NifS [Thermalbibacter longus]